MMDQDFVFGKELNEDWRYAEYKQWSNINKVDLGGVKNGLESVS